MTVPLHYPTPNLNQMTNCLASLKSHLHCGLRFRVVVFILLHATTHEARTALTKVLGHVDLTVLLAVLFNPDLDSLVVVPVSELVDAEPGTPAQLTEFATPDGVESRGAAWMSRLSGKDPSTLESTFRTAPNTS